MSFDSGQHLTFKANSIPETLGCPTFNNNPVVSDVGYIRLERRYGIISLIRFPYDQF